LLSLRPTPKLEDHPVSAVRDCLFTIFAATFLIGGRSSIRNPRTRHAVVTGTHSSQGCCRPIHLFSHLWMNPSCLFYFRNYSETKYFLQPYQICSYSEKAEYRMPRNPSSIVGKRSVSCPKHPDRFWVPQGLLLYGYQRTFPRRYKQPSGEADQSSRSTVEIKNEWSYTRVSSIVCTADIWIISDTVSVHLHIL
jgi:hypothetical protein